jgi:hypothetical protein
MFHGSETQVFHWRNSTKMALGGRGLALNVNDNKHIVILAAFGQGLQVQTCAACPSTFNIQPID